MDRVQNRRGEGARLRDEIVTAATALLEESGSEDAVTLRGVARRAGIAAPSIYAHFADRDAIVDAVVADAFAQLDAALAAAQDGSDPQRGLERLCRAYLAFAREAPNRYRVAFERNGADAGRARQFSGVSAFDRLVAAVAARSGRPESAQLDATALWVALHGYATLSARLPAFPWPDHDALLRVLVDRSG